MEKTTMPLAFAPYIYNALYPTPILFIQYKHGHLVVHICVPFIYEKMPTKYYFIQNYFIIPVHSPRKLPLPTCLIPGNRKTKINAILFEWFPNTFDSFEDHATVHCGSSRSMRTNAVRDFFEASL